MFEIAETPLFELEQGMAGEIPESPLVSVIGDIRDRRRGGLRDHAHPRYYAAA
jgi:FlaA1/EpsC-like NDP-sugar epimerase